MSRLVAAVVILLGALLGLSVLRSPNFRQTFLNQFGSSSQTQTTGFSTPVPTDGSTISQGTGTPSVSQNTPPTNSNTNNTRPNRPNRPPRPIPGGW